MLKNIEARDGNIIESFNPSIHLKHWDYLLSMRYLVITIMFVFDILVLDVCKWPVEHFSYISSISNLVIVICHQNKDWIADGV